MAERIVAYRLQGKWYTPKRMSELKAKDDYARVYALPYTAEMVARYEQRTGERITLNRRVA